MTAITFRYQLTVAASESNEAIERGLIGPCQLFGKPCEVTAATVTGRDGYVVDVEFTLSVDDTIAEGLGCLFRGDASQFSIVR